MSFGFSVVVGNWVVTLLEHHGHSKRAAAIAGSLTLLLGFFTRVAGGSLLRRADAPRWIAASLVARRCRRDRARAAAAATRCSSPPPRVVGLAAGIPFAKAFTGAAAARPDAPGAAVGFVNAWASLVIVAGTPLVGLTFSLPGDGRIGFVVARRPRCSGRARNPAVGSSSPQLDFGVTVLPDPPFSRWLELIQLAERHGFEYAWTYDSHVLWQESIPMLAVAARETSKIKLGHFVTNPATRDPTVLASSYATLHDLSDGRMVMGVGRGDSAVRYIGRQPMKVAEFEKALRDGQGVHERPRGELERQGAPAEVGARRSCRRSRCGSRATARRRSPSRGASATA